MGPINSVTHSPRSLFDHHLAHRVVVYPRCRSRGDVLQIDLEPLMVVPLVLALAATSAAAVKDAVVMVGDCSGVCVDPCGLVLTAKHCDHPPS